MEERDDERRRRTTLVEEQVEAVAELAVKCVNRELAMDDLQYWVYKIAIPLTCFCFWNNKSPEGQQRKITTLENPKSAI